MYIGQSVLSPSSVADLVSQYGNATVAVGYTNSSAFEILGSGFLSRTLKDHFLVTTCAHVVENSVDTIFVRFSFNLNFAHACKIMYFDKVTDFALLGCIKTDTFSKYVVTAPTILPSEQYRATGMVRYEKNIILNNSIIIYTHKIIYYICSSSRIFWR